VINDVTTTIVVVQGDYWCYYHNCC